MSRLFISLNIFFVLIATTTSLTEHNPKPRAFVLPVLRGSNPDGPYYYTNVTVGKPPLVVSLNIDISGKALWFECEDVGYNSTTYTPVLCGSSKCKQAKGECSPCSGTYGPACRNDTCTSSTGTLLEDEVTLSYTSPSAHVAANLKLASKMPLACMPSYRGMMYRPTGTQGIIGLGNASMSSVNHLVSSYNIPFKVALCLPSKPGKENSGLVYIGGGPYVLPPNGKDVSGLFVSTPLIQKIREDLDDIYYIDVKSIQVNAKRIPFNRDQLAYNKSSELGGTMIRSTIPYTYLESSIYKALLKAFFIMPRSQKPWLRLMTALALKILVESRSQQDSSDQFGIGRGSQVEYLWAKFVGEGKQVCGMFSVLNGGNGWVNPILIGGYQMQDNLVEFDLEASRFSISSSVLLHNIYIRQSPMIKSLETLLNSSFLLLLLFQKKKKKA